MVKVGKRSKSKADYDSTKAKKPRCNKPDPQPPGMGDASDSKNNLGHSTSKENLAAAKEPAKRSHAVVSNLKKIVEEEKKRLATSFEETVASVKKRDSGLKDTLIKVIIDARLEQTEMDKERVKHLSTSNYTTSAVYHRTKSNIASSRELLMHYERASQQVAFSKGFPMMESGWKKGSQTLQRVLNKQEEKVKLELHQLLDEDLNRPKARVVGDVSNLDTDLWDRFAMGETKEEQIEMLDGGKGATWAVIARNAQRGVRRAVKHLPEDAEYRSR